MQIYGKEVKFSISNKKHAEKFEFALKKMEQDEKKIKSANQEKMSDVLDAVLAMFRNFFVNATETDVLADCEDAMEARTAYEEFLSELEHQKESFLQPFDLKRIK